MYGKKKLMQNRSICILMEVGGENRVKIGIVIKYEEKIHDFDEASVREAYQSVTWPPTLEVSFTGWQIVTFYDLGLFQHLQLISDYCDIKREHSLKAISQMESINRFETNTANCATLLTSVNDLSAFYIPFLHRCRTCPPLLLFWV